MDTKNLEKKMETISPFELKNQLIDMADESLKKTARTMLNAGRGNPNWIATTPREAFFLLGQFGLEECRRVMNLPEGIAGIPQKEGIASRFEAFLKKNNAAHGAKLLEQTYNYLLMQHAADPDSLVHEWAEAVIGDQYPVPDRILHFTEILVQDYLSQEMCDNRPPRGTFDLFATEGGTAAMCYLFDSLQENFLLDKGDGIALMVPAFTPYIEIPQLSRYQFNMIELHADRMTDDSGIKDKGLNQEGKSGYYNPLLRTGLALSGASKAWKDSASLNLPNDGLLTAYEIFGMSLLNTDLVVLSACNTGLGEIRDGEGVYGLQRAFRSAGARNMIMTLAEVSDKETAEFMTLFYQNWKFKTSKRVAFVKAQGEMMKRHHKEPEKWAYFVLIE